MSAVPACKFEAYSVFNCTDPSQDLLEFQLVILILRPIFRNSDRNIEVGEELAGVTRVASRGVYRTKMLTNTYTEKRTVFVNKGFVGGADAQPVWKQANDSILYRIPLITARANEKRNVRKL
jgi:hypothetical protein